MKLNILIGGKAGQGINKISEIVARILADFGYFSFNYRDYGSLIRGGNNFNILSISDKRVDSYDSEIDVIVAMDDKTMALHKSKLKKSGFIISYEKFEKENLGRNLNLALAGSLVKILGIDKKILIEEVEKEFKNEEAVKAAEIGYESESKDKCILCLKRLNNKIKIMTGSSGIVKGAINSGINLYLAYPMTPATPVLHELASKQFKDKNNLMVFMPENEIAVINAGLGASFAGKKVMVGTSGGGFDLMTEALSFQGQSEIPIVVYLASRPGPSTGMPTYTSQGDLDVALHSGHGEFPRIVIAPGNPKECEEKTNEAFYLAEKFKCQVIILSDKHLAESEFSFDTKLNKPLKIEIKRKLPGNDIVKASSYSHDDYGNTTEDAELIKQGHERRLRKYEKIKEFLKSKEISKFQMIKIYGDKNSKNLIIGWGSTKGAILDAIKELDVKFLQVLYLKPLSDNIKKEMENSIKKKGKIILIENNLTGQLGRLLREKTGISIPSENRILKYDGRPFACDELRKEIIARLGEPSVRKK